MSGPLLRRDLASWLKSAAWLAVCFAGFVFWRGFFPSDRQVHPALAFVTHIVLVISNVMLAASLAAWLLHRRRSLKNYARQS